MANKPYLPDVQSLLNAGINPKNGLPLKICNANNEAILQSINLALRVKDEQDAIMRYRWYNLPNGLNSQLVERMLYYKGQLMFFYVSELKQYYMLPYTLNGNIDAYRRFTGVSPVVLGDSIEETNKKPIPFLPGLVRKPIYDILSEDNEEDITETGCVLLSDYTEQWNPKIIPRQQIQDPVIKMIAETLPLARTNLIANSGTRGLRIDNESMQWTVDEANKTFYDYAISGKPLVPLVGATEMQELTGANASRSEEYLMFAQSIDNIRLSLLGLENGGIFEKKAHLLQSEADMNDGVTESALIDGLMNRQRFCDMVNSIWGLNIWCECSEVANQLDKNGDGQIGEDLDQSGSIVGDNASEVSDNEVL